MFRDDLPMKFSVDAAAYQMLLDNLDRDLRFSIEVENGTNLEDITNYDEVVIQMHSRPHTLPSTHTSIQPPIQPVVAQPSLGRNYP